MGMLSLYRCKWEIFCQVEEFSSVSVFKVTIVMLSDAARRCYNGVSRTQRWHPGWWRMAWYGRAGESATGVVVFSVGTRVGGAHHDGCRMSQAVRGGDVDVYFSDSFYEVKVSTKKNWQLEGVLFGNKFKSKVSQLKEPH